MPIWVNPGALRRGDSAPRYAACIGATTIGEYVALHRAYTTAQGILHKPPRADLLWAIERGDIRHVEDPSIHVRRAHAGAVVDHATALLALRCDHMLVREAWRPFPISKCNPPSPPPFLWRSARGTATTRASTLRHTPRACAYYARPWRMTSPLAATVMRTTTRRMSIGPAGQWTQASPCSFRPLRPAWWPCLFAGSHARPQMGHSPRLARGRG
jgi:hypothetical protein